MTGKGFNRKRIKQNSGKDWHGGEKTKCAKSEKEAGLLRGSI